MYLTNVIRQCMTMKKLIHQWAEYMDMEDLQMAKSRWTLVFDTECYAKFGGSKDNLKKCFKNNFLIII